MFIHEPSGSVGGVPFCNRPFVFIIFDYFQKQIERFLILWQNQTTIDADSESHQFFDPNWVRYFSVEKFEIPKKICQDTIIINKDLHCGGGF